LEKLAAVHCAVQLENAPAIAQSGRHLYDIFHLLSSEEVRGDLRRLGQNAVAELSEEINTTAQGLCSLGRLDLMVVLRTAQCLTHNIRRERASSRPSTSLRICFLGEKFRLPELDELVALHRNLL